MNIWNYNMPVTVICGGIQRVWQSRNKAIEEFYEGAMACEGSESLRYQRILGELLDGCEICTDE